MGLPFVVLNMVTVLMFKGLEVDDKLITFWTSLILLPWTLEAIVESFPGTFPDKEIFVIVTQLITGVTFGLVAFALNLSHFSVFPLRCCVLLLAELLTTSLAMECI